MHTRKQHAWMDTERCAILQCCRKPQSFRELSCFHILQHIMGICSTYCRFNGIPGNVLPNLTITLSLSFQTQMFFFWGLKWLKRPLKYDKGFVWCYIPDALCEEQTKNVPKVNILSDLFIAVGHKTATVTDSFMIWNLAHKSFGWFLWYFNGTFQSFLNLTSTDGGIINYPFLVKSLFLGWTGASTDLFSA